MMNKLVSIAIVFTALFFGGFQLSYVNAQMNGKSERKFPEPSGSYNIGTMEFYWIDNERDEILTTNPDDKRRLIVQVWYPTDKKLKGDGRPYIANPDEFGDNEEIKKLSDIKTNSIYEAPISKKLDKFPVLIYSHGMQRSRFANTSQIEHLVSHGYIVFGIDHTFYNRSEEYPDGYKLVSDVEPGFVRDEDNIQKTFSDMMKYFDDVVLMKIWAKDSEFVLSKVKELNSREGIFHNRIDLSKLGIFGYSFGGITALQMCYDHPEIKAGLSYDGGKFGTVKDHGITQPFFFVEREIIPKSKEEHEAEGENHEFKILQYTTFAERDRFFFENATNENYILTFSNVGHGHFDDLGLFSPVDKDLMDVRLCHDILNEYTLTFFDKYLKNIESDLLDEIPGKYKEAVLEKKGNF